MLDESALKYLVELGQIERFEVDGQTYVMQSNGNLHRIKIPLPDQLTLHTLTGLVDYIKSMIDDLGRNDSPVFADGEGADGKEINVSFNTGTPVLIQVMSPTRVALMSPLMKDQRFTFAICEAMTPSIEYERFIDLEQFNIMLQSRFVQTEDRDIILKLIGTIKEESTQETMDDGVTQVVTAKTGIARYGNVEVPNPVNLRPCRTFHEIEQPESMFVFRMQSGPRAALFEADGGAWKSRTMGYIKNYLVEQLEGYNVKVLA
jgi:hypothetical protein